MCTFIEMEDKEFTRYINENGTVMEKSVTEKCVIKALIDNILNKQDFVNILRRWKIDNTQRLTLILNDICKNEISREDCKDFFLNRIIPNMMSLEYEERIRDNLVEIALMMCNIIPVTDLTQNEYQLFISRLSSQYIHSISSLRDSNYANWHKLWIFLVRFCAKKIHESMDLTNKLLRIVEYAFRNPSFEQRLRGYDCWKELIDNASLDSNHISTPKQIKLLVTPLRAKFSKQEIVICKRFDIFVYLLQKLGKNGTLCLTEFLEFCFGIVGDSKDNSKSGQIKSVPQIWSKCARVLVGILGHSHKVPEDGECIKEVKFECPLVSTENMKNFYKILIKSVADCCALLKIEKLENKRNVTIRCMWKSVFNLIIISSGDEKNMYFTTVSDVLYTYLEQSKETTYFEELLIQIFITLMAFEDHLDDLIPLVLKQSTLIYISVDLQNYSTYNNRFIETLTQYLSTVGHNEMQPLQQVLDCLHHQNSNDINIINYANIWNIVASEMHTSWNPDKIEEFSKFSEFFYWPSQNLHRLEEPKKKQIVLNWMKLYMKLCTNKDHKKCNTIKELEKRFKTNPLLSSNISSLLNVISQFETTFSREFVTSLMEAVCFVLELPNLCAEDEEKLSSLVIQYFEPSLECYNSENVEKMIKAICKCIEHVLLIHSNFVILNPLIDFIKNTTENVKILFSEYMKDFALQLCKKESDLTNLNQVKEILKLIPLFGYKDIAEDKKTFVIPTGRSARIATMGKDSPTSPHKSAKSNTPLRLFGKDPENMSLLKVKGSQLNNTPINSKKKNANVIVVKRITTRSLNEENSLDFVPIDTEVKLQLDKLSEHQKEVLKKRREDIPALYQDLSQSISQDMFSSKSNSKETNQEIVIKNTDILFEKVPLTIPASESYVFSQLSKDLHGSEETEKPNVEGKPNQNDSVTFTQKPQDQEKIIEEPLSDDIFSTLRSITPIQTSEDSLQKKKKREIDRLKMDIVGANQFYESPSRTRIKKAPKKENEIPNVTENGRKKIDKEKRSNSGMDKSQDPEVIQEIDQQVNDSKKEIIVEEPLPSGKLDEKMQKCGIEIEDLLNKSLKLMNDSIHSNKNESTASPKKSKKKDISNEENNVTEEYNDFKIIDEASLTPKPTKRRRNSSAKNVTELDIQQKSSNNPEKSTVDIKVNSNLEVAKRSRGRPKKSLENKNLKQMNQPYLDKNSEIAPQKETTIKSTLECINLKIKIIKNRRSNSHELKQIQEATIDNKLEIGYEKKTPEVVSTSPKNKQKKRLFNTEELKQMNEPITKNESDIESSKQPVTEPALINTNTKHKHKKRISSIDGLLQMKERVTENKSVIAYEEQTIIETAVVSTSPKNKHKKRHFDKLNQIEDALVTNKSAISKIELQKESIVTPTIDNTNVSKNKRRFGSHGSEPKSRSAKIIEKLGSPTNTERKSPRIHTKKLEKGTEVSPSPVKNLNETPKNVKTGKTHKKKLDLDQDSTILETQKTAQNKRGKRKIVNEENEDVIESSQESFMDLMPLLNSSKKRSRLEEARGNITEENKSVSDDVGSLIQSLSLIHSSKIELIEEDSSNNDKPKETLNSQDTTLSQNTSVESETFSKNSALDTFEILSKIEIEPVSIESPELPKKPILTESELIMCHMDTMSVCDAKDTIVSEEPFKTPKALDVRELTPTVSLNSIEDILATPSTDTVPSSRSDSPSTPMQTQSLPSSPITADTPNRTNEFLDNTMDISPINSRSNSQDTHPDFDETKKGDDNVKIEPMEEIQELVLKVQEIVDEKDDTFEEGDSLDGSEKINASSEAEMTPLDPAAQNNQEELTVQALSCPNDENPIQNGDISTTIDIASNREFKELTTTQDQSCKLQNLMHSIANKPFAKRKGSTTSSPSMIRTKKLFLNIGSKQTDSQEMFENFSENDILTFSREIPSPLAVPRSSILKRKFSDSSVGEGISPCAKRKRVNFSDPCLTSKKIFIKDEYQPSIEAKRLFDNTPERKATDDRLKEIFDDSPYSEFSTETDSDIPETEPSLTVVNPLILQKIKPIFPSLVDCKDDVLIIVKKVTSPMFVPALMNKLKGKNVKSVGDLARLSEAEVNRFPFKVPVVANVIKALENYQKKKYGMEARSEEIFGNIKDDDKRNGGVEMPKLDVILEFQMLLKRAQRENVQTQELAKVLIPHVDQSQLYPLIKSHCPSLVLDTIEDKDYNTILKIIIDSKGISEILKMAYVTFNNKNKEHDFYQEIADYVKYTVPLEKFFKGRTIEDLVEGIEESIKNKVFQKSEMIENCLLPLVESPDDISSYLYSISSVSFNEIVVNRLKQDDPSVFFERIIMLCDSEERKIVSNTLWCQERASPLEIVSCLEKKLELQSEKDRNQSMVEMFKFISEKLDVKTLVNLHLGFLTRISEELKRN